MNERVKFFVHQFLNVEPTCLDSLERDVNAWLCRTEGKLIKVEHSQSTQPGMGQSTVISLWYLPSDGERS